VGAVLDVVMGRLAGPLVSLSRRAVDERIRALTGLWDSSPDRRPGHVVRDSYW